MEKADLIKGVIAFVYFITFIIVSGLLFNYNKKKKIKEKEKTLKTELKLKQKLLKHLLDTYDIFLPEKFYSYKEFGLNLDLEKFSLDPEKDIASTEDSLNNKSSSFKQNLMENFINDQELKNETEEEFVKMYDDLLATYISFLKNRKKLKDFSVAEYESLCKEEAMFYGYDRKDIITQNHFHFQLLLRH